MYSPVKQNVDPILNNGDSCRQSSLLAMVTSRRPPSTMMVHPDDNDLVASPDQSVGPSSSEMEMSTSLSYPGGKNGCGSYQRIINQIPRHNVYIESFAGSAAVYRNKKKCQLSVLIDKDDQAPIFSWPASPGLLVLQEDGIEWLAEDGIGYNKNTFIYLDPPYLLATRNSKRPLYRVEMTSSQHRRLLAVIRSLKCHVAISGYWSQMYSRELHDWRVISWQSKTRGNTLATEYLWMNYPEPDQLHDYRYLGDDFRDRERIKKKARRWKRNLDSMSRDDRLAVLAAIRGDLDV